MSLNQIIRGRMKSFAEEREITNLHEDKIFERFVNYHIIYSQHPEAFLGNTDIIEEITVAGGEDGSIDGIALIINDQIVSTKDEFNDILQTRSKIAIEIFFIQAKNSSKTRSGDFNNFLDGIRSLFLSNPNLLMNNKLKEKKALIDLVFSDDYIQLWKPRPRLHVFYVNLGHGETSHTNNHTKLFISDLEKQRLFDSEVISVNVVGSKEFYTICERNDNEFSATITIKQMMPLADVKGVKNGCLVLCYANEFLKLIQYEDENLRKIAFTDNVRDFQGDSGVNRDIEQTIRDVPDQFAMLNNGITVVCSKFTPTNYSLYIKNPQIVNGCQTSNIIYRSKQHSDISKVPVILKIIETEDYEITNQIVKGTNSQNIVYSEMFEITKTFHRHLEQFFMTCSFGEKKLFYERRTRQFQDHPTVKQSQKVSFKNLIQASCAIILECPELAYKHESILIKDFAGRVFHESHSMLPYYIASALHNELATYFMHHPIKRKTYIAYKYHILLIMKLLSQTDIQPSLSNLKQIDVYYKNLEETVIKNSMAYIGNSIEKFESYRKQWINLGNSKYAIKDNAKFTGFLIQQFRKKSQGEPENYGTVSSISLDRNGRQYGWINVANDQIFFHQSSSPSFDWAGRHIGSSVVFDRSLSKRNDPMAKNVTLVET